MNELRKKKEKFYIFFFIFLSHLPRPREWKIKILFRRRELGKELLTHQNVFVFQHICCRIKCGWTLSLTVFQMQTKRAKLIFQWNSWENKYTFFGRIFDLLIERKIFGQSLLNRTKVSKNIALSVCEWTVIILLKTKK